jgi:hypothetical protein
MENLKSLKIDFHMNLNLSFDEKFKKTVSEGGKIFDSDT